MSQRTTSLLVKKDQAGTRLDLFLARQFSDNTRSYWTNMIKHEYVLVNESSVKTGYLLKKGETIRIVWPEVTREFVQKITTIHETKDVLVLDKPAGMLVHSKGQFNPEYTVSDFATERGAIGEGDRVGIVHRLDRQTSGVMVVAKTPQALSELQRQFAKRLVQKYYVAVIEGSLADDQITLDLPLLRNPKKPKTFCVNPNGKPAQTVVRQIQQHTHESVIIVKPITGRTHQIRVHLSHLGKPIAGDVQYGAKKQFPRQRFLLHSYSLTICLPGQSESQTFIAPIPQDMTSYIHEDQLNQFA